MPNIIQLNAPSGLGLTPTETGIDATQGAARREGTFYAQKADAINSTGARIASATKDALDQVEDFETHREISKGAADSSALTASLIDQWNQTAKNADPNDPTVAAKFKDQVLTPALEQYQSGFNTERSQQFAEHQVDQLRQHMFEKTSADMSTLAGEAVKVNARKTVNNLVSAVSADPSSLDFALGSVNHMLGSMADSSPNLSAAQSGAVKTSIIQDAKESLVKAAITGMITKNPNIDLDAVQKKYGDYINGPEMKMFQKAAQTQAKSNALIDKQAQVAQRQLDEQAVRSGSTKIMTDNITFDPDTGHPIVDPKFFSQALDLAKKNPNAPNAAETVRTLFSWGESQQNKAAKIVDDPQVKASLTDRMFDPDNPTSRIDLMKAQADGKLSNSSFQSMNRLVGEFEKTPLRGDIWKSTTSAVRDRLIRTDLPEGRDAVGAANYASFMQAFLPEYLHKSRDGTLPPNALDLNDPKSMISQSLAPYKSSMQDRLRTQATTPAAAAAAEPAKPEIPAAPTTPADRIKDTVYRTPRGALKWTGTGWVAP